MRAYTDFCCTSYAQRKRDECWATLRQFFGAYDDRKHDASSTAPLPQEVDSILLLVNLAAKNGHQINPEKVYIKSCWSTMGPMGNMKRMLPAPQGRSYTFKRKVCHLTVIVSDERVGKGK